MSDPRLTPATPRVMAAHLPEDGSGRARVAGHPMRIGAPVVDLLRRPDGPRDRQLLMGDTVTVFETADTHAFLQAEKDGYVGYVETSGLEERSAPPTHRVRALATHLYSAPDLKSPDRASLSAGSLLHVTAEEGAFWETPQGFIPKPHLAPVASVEEDPLSTASLFLGTPYLWGGNSCWGIDCSGLVQAACLACGIPCPGDSDQQERQLGTLVAPGTAPKRGDLLFWKGHVAWVLDDTSVLHANAHAMSVTVEDCAETIARIAAAGDGPVTSHKRL